MTACMPADHGVPRLSARPVQENVVDPQAASHQAMEGGDSRAEELLSLVEALWTARSDRYSEERAQQAVIHRENVEMYHIGG